MKRIIFSLICIALCLPSISLAQLPSNLTGGAGISIDLNPANPRPLQTFSASLNDFSTGNSGGTISWFVDGELQTQFSNQRAIELSAAPLSKTLTLTVRVTPTNGSPSETTRKITATAIDIIIEPYTFVPDFYKGRALPSPFSSVRAVAIPHTTDEVAAYNWRLDGKNISSGPVSGNSIVFTTPLGRRATLVVDAINRRGSIIASRAISLPIVEPEVLFYEATTLKGLVQKPLTNGFQFIGSEITLAAAPYYVSNTIFDANTLMEWTVNNVKQPLNLNNPLNLTIVRNNTLDTSFRVGLRIRNLDNLLEGTEGNLQVRF